MLTAAFKDIYSVVFKSSKKCLSNEYTIRQPETEPFGAFLCLFWSAESLLS